MLNNFYNPQNIPNNLPNSMNFQSKQNNHPNWQFQSQPNSRNFFQPSANRPQIFGRFVNSQDDITENDIPTDGSFAVFPTRDLSCVYVMAWTTNGTIDGYKMVPESKQAPTKSDDLSNIKSYFDEKFTELSDLLTTPSKKAITHE